LNRELFMVFIPGISFILFALGGTQISNTISGWKGWRRIVLPIIYVISLLIALNAPYRAFYVGLIAWGAFSLGYGNGKTWLYRFMVGCTYALISIPIGFSMWNIVTVVGFITLFILSNTPLTSKYFVWKICEGGFGLLCGIQIAYLLL